MKKIGGFGFFVGDVVSGIVLWPFWLRLQGPGSNHKVEVFRSSFYWKLG